MHALHASLAPRGRGRASRTRRSRLLSSRTGRYGIALAGPLVALLIQSALWPFTHTVPFVFFFLAVMVAGWGGWGPAIVSIVFSLLALGHVFLPPVGPSGPSPGNMLALSLFVLVSLGLTWLTVSRRNFSAERRLLLASEQAARREAETERIRLHTILQDAPALITLFRGPEHRCVLSNARNAEFLQGRDILDKSLRQALPELEDQRLTELVDQVFTTERPFSAKEVPVWIERVDGTPWELFVNICLQPTRDAEGRVDGVASFAYDVTELVLARSRAEKAEDSLRRLADSIPAFIWSTGPEGVIDYYNRPWYEYTGIPQGSVDRALVLSVCHPEDLGPIDQRWREGLERGEPIQSEIRILRASDQTWRWHLVRTVPWKDASGRVARWFGTSIDIDEQKRAEAALRESEARFRNMADHAPVMLWVTDAAHHCTYFSRPWYTFTGLPEAGDLDCQWREAVHPDDRVPAKESVRPVMSQHEPFQKDYRLRRADGEYRWVSDSATPRFSDCGDFLGYIGSIIDVTDRKRSEDLLVLLARAGSVLGTSLDETETLTAATRISVPTFADWCLVDLRREDGSFQRMRAAHADPGDAELAHQLLRFSLMPEGNVQHPPTQALLRGEALLIEHFTPERIAQSGHTDEHARAMQRVGAVSGIFVPLVARGSTLGVLSFFTSHSGRHYTEKDLPVAQELARRVALSVDNARLYASAQEAVRLRDEFLSVASHELKTPLTPLSIKLQVLAQKAAAQPESPFAREVLAHVEVGRKQVRKLGELIGDLLDVSRISAGRMKLAWEPVDLAALLREVVSRCEDQADRQGTPLQLEAPRSLVGSWDAMRLEQVVVNLLDNAIKYGPGKPVRLRLEEDSGKAVLTVKDEGIGITAGAQRRIFDRFMRGVSDRHYGGLGLGLYITKNCVEAMGGSIQVQSELGQGALFTVVLPLSASA
ncbi:MAG TPA: PAS domain S-box protein [Hyalangium sp.]|nr:PAS domain S-box protein [Hyalangium sp.]